LNSNNRHIEKELFYRIAEGDEMAFKELYNSYGKILFPFLFKLTNAADIADEIIQEVFLRIWLYRHKLPDVEYPRAWIFKIASNQTYDWLKKNALAAKAVNENYNNKDYNVNTTEETLTINEIKCLVNKAVAALPHKRRLIYKLNREDGMKVAEIAAHLAISVSTVKNALLIAVKSVAESLEKTGFKQLLLVAFFYLKSFFQ
jgi:RNA polymerase sigma factor (sigma-70 family)